MATEYVSTIPADAMERVVSEYRFEETPDGMGGSEWLRTVEFSVDDIVVGQRFFGADGELRMETPLRDGLKHGIEYSWHENGQLELAEPYAEGRIHGTAYQWDDDGRLLGEYTLTQGTGLDVWRQIDDDGAIYVSEIQTYLNGKWHGYGWWFAYGGEIDRETHWHEGVPHGIERDWNEKGVLEAGMPAFFIQGEQVERATYLAAAAHDTTLPPYREEDDRRDRDLPPEIAALYSR